MVARSRIALAASLAAATLAAATLAAATLAACTASRPAMPPFRITVDETASTGMTRRVVSVGEFGAIVEGPVGTVVLRPTGAALPRSYALTLVVGDTTAGGAPGSGSDGRLEGLTIEADTWRVETASGLAERVSEGGWGTSAPPGTHVRIEAGAPGEVRVTLGAEAVRRIARAGRGRVAWVDAYRR